MGQYTQLRTRWIEHVIKDLYVTARIIEYIEQTKQRRLEKPNQLSHPLVSFSVAIASCFCGETVYINDFPGFVTKRAEQEKEQH